MTIRNHIAILSSLALMSVYANSTCPTAEVIVDILKARKGIKKADVLPINGTNWNVTLVAGDLATNYSAFLDIRPTLNAVAVAREDAVTHKTLCSYHFGDGKSFRFRIYIEN
jgi:hypothetical protein